MQQDTRPKLVPRSPLIEIMAKHKTMYVDSGNKKDFNMLQFLKELDESYEFVNVSNYFNSYLEEQNRKKNHAETVYNRLVGNSAKNKCDITKCICVERNKDQSDKSYSGLSAKDAAYHSEMDNIHIQLYHLYDLGLRLTEKERESIYGDTNLSAADIDKKFRECMSKKSRNTNYRRSTKNNKFVTVIRDESQSKTTFRDWTMTRLATIHPEKKDHVYKIAQWIKDEKYDTDSLCEYISAQKDKTLCENIHRIVTASDADLATKLKRFIMNNHPEKVYYSFGFRFYYWDFYKNNENETNIIRVDKQNKRQRKWYDPGNANYKCREWYIKPHFASIQEEALESRTINADLWRSKHQKANMKLEQEFCRLMQANDLWEITYKIESGSKLTLDHVICVILYTDSSKFCDEFSKSFRKISPFETEESLKKRHSRFYHTAKALRELIEVYGSQFAHTSYRTFYHGINCQMYFKTCYAKIAGPMSTTTDEIVAHNKFAGDQGIVLHLVNKNDLTFFIDCMKFSCFTDERECLFLGGFAPIPFAKIKVVETRKLLEEGIQIIAVLTKMLSSASNDQKLKDKRIKLMKLLLEHQANNCEFDELNQMNQYEIDLFRCFCINLEKINCDMYAMSRVELHQGREDSAFESKLFGYKQIYDIFFNEEFDIIKLDFVLKLFPKLKNLAMNGWITTKYEEKNKAMGLMKYILDSLSIHLTKAHSLKEIVIVLQAKMALKNTYCPKEHVSESTITDVDGYFCDNCNTEWPKDTELFGCFDVETDCDYCVCSKCYEKENMDVKYLQESIDEYNPKFTEQIEWNVGVKVWKDHLDKEYDAIWFTSNN